MERLWALALAGAAVPSRIRHLDPTENGVDRRAAGLLAGVPTAALPKHTASLPIALHLLCNDEILHGCQQRFALLQIHAQCFHRQLTLLDRQDLTALFAAVGLYTYD